MTCLTRSHFVVNPNPTPTNGRAAKRKATPKTGGAERVLDAIKKGVATRHDLILFLDMNGDAVTNALARLVDAEKVRKDGRNRYVVNTAPALGETWK